jgi:hypothetical protein
MAVAVVVRLALTIMGGLVPVMVLEVDQILGEALVVLVVLMGMMVVEVNLLRTEVVVVVLPLLVVMELLVLEKPIIGVQGVI